MKSPKVEPKVIYAWLEPSKDCTEAQEATVYRGLSTGYSGQVWGPKAWYEAMESCLEALEAWLEAPEAWIEAPEAPEAWFEASEANRCADTWTDAQDKRPLSPLWGRCPRNNFPWRIQIKQLAETQKRNIFWDIQKKDSIQKKESYFSCHSLNLPTYSITTWMECLPITLGDYLK